jgi:hypothetical protein
MTRCLQATIDQTVVPTKKAALSGTAFRTLRQVLTEPLSPPSRSGAEKSLYRHHIKFFVNGNEITAAPTITKKKQGI